MTKVWPRICLRLSDPVRAGLVRAERDWPYVFIPGTADDAILVGAIDPNRPGENRHAAKRR